MSKYVWIYFYLTMAISVSVFGGYFDGATNVALNGTATQNSINYGGVPARAIDGDTNGAWSGDSVTHTAFEAQPWWQVDLGDSYDIDEIVIWGRTDSSAASRLSDYDVFIFDDSSQDPVWSNYQADYPDPMVSLNPGGIAGQYVVVQLRGTDALSLAEVQVYGTVVPEPATLLLLGIGVVMMRRRKGVKTHHT